MLNRWKTIVLIAVVVGVTGTTWYAAWFWDRLVGNAPVRFYGRVVDRDAVPIPGVAVHATLTRSRFVSHPMWPQQTREELTAVTDGEGRFHFTAARGTSLQLGVFEKQGWTPWTQGLINSEYSFRYPLTGYEYPPGMRKKPDNPEDPIVYWMVPAAPQPSWWPIAQERK